MPNYGRTIYTSESLEESEKKAGEKLYKFSEGVYVNQATYDFIHSEAHPFIEFEFSETFIAQTDFVSGMVCAVWHPNALRLFCIGFSQDKQLVCRVLKIDNDHVVVEAESPIGLAQHAKSIRDVAHHPSLPYLFIACEDQFVVWDYSNNQLVANQVMDYDVRQVGFYPDQHTAWAMAIDKDYGASSQWIMWDYLSGDLNVYDLEVHDHYGRGAILHPSGLFIGSLWNAYACGYLFHTAQPQANALSYYAQPAADRKEYEAYSPCFSPDGKRFAFFANPWLGMRKNYSKVCVYDAATAALIIEFYTGLSITELQLQFVDGGRTLAFIERASNRLHIFRPTSGKKIATLKAVSHINCLAGHRLFNYYAVVHESGVTVFSSSTSGNAAVDGGSFDTMAMEAGKRFVEMNASHLTKVGND